MTPSRRRLLARYVRTFPDKQAALAAALATIDQGRDPSFDATAVRRLCHKIAGSGAMYGFVELSNLARTAEQAAPPEVLGAVQALLDELGEQYAARIDEFSDLPG